MKSSFELGGYEKEDEVASPQPRKTKAGMNPITGTVVGEDGKEVAVTMVQMVEKFEKSCKVALMLMFSVSHKKISGSSWRALHTSLVKC